jgi:two-component system sensor histidine kinase KdpD
VKSFVTLPFRPGTPPPWYGPLGYAVTVIAVAIATGGLELLFPLLSVASIYLVYLVVVVAVSVGWGLKQGIFASVLGFLAANFFFTQPLFTFTVSAVQDIIALVTFLGLATLTSELVSRLRREAQEARRNQQITATLYTLSQTLTRQHYLPALLNEVTSQLCSILDLAACTIHLRGIEGLGTLTANSGPVLQEEPPAPHVVSTRLFAGGNRIGTLLIQLPKSRRSITEEEQRIVAAFAEQLQIAIERAQLQQAAIQTEVLRRTDALRVALLSAVAHDLRTPLTSIKTAAGSLLKPPTAVEWSRDDQRDFLTAIIEEVDRINRLVSNLLDVSRIEAGRLRPHKELYRIQELINTVVERLAPMLEEHPISVRVEPNLPTVPMDVIQTDEVLTNLLENAIKYTPSGTPIELAARRVGEAIEVEVADRGPGIPPEHLSHLFSRFYRVTADASNASGASRTPGGLGKATGTGLGLAIVKGIVEAHGGQVSAANRPGGGAVFRFTLPLDARAERMDTGPIMPHEIASTEPTAAEKELTR